MYSAVLGLLFQRKQSTVKETSGDYEIIRIVNTFSFTEIYSIMLMTKVLDLLNQ